MRYLFPVALFIIISVCLFAEEIPSGSIDSGMIVTRHQVDNVWFENDSTDGFIWDLSGAIECGKYDVRFRADADSVFDVTKMGRRTDFKFLDKRLFLWGIENARTRLADSKGIPLAIMPVVKDMDFRCYPKALKPVGFSLLTQPDSVGVWCRFVNTGKMIFPEGDTLTVARITLDFRYDKHTHRLNYWFADSCIIPVARQYIRFTGDEVENHTFAYTCPSEILDAVKIYDKLLSRLGIELFSDGVFETPGYYGNHGMDEWKGQHGGHDVSDKSVDVAVASMPREDFTSVITDAKGVVWSTGNGKTDFNIAKVHINDLPTGYYIISVRTSAGEQTSIKYFHEQK